MKNQTRSQIVKSLNRQIKDFPTYFDNIPLEELFQIASNNGYTPIMEDNTEWQGLLCGRSESVVFELARSDTKDSNGFYVSDKRPIGLSLSWYVMESGKVEIVAYFG